MTYYNDNDIIVAEWLRRLTNDGRITGGKIDERSITEIEPGDVAGFIRAHFFAGIAGWEIALELAGWPDWLPVWTGSCPCQSFSGAGLRKGFDDPRHLFPYWMRLIRECRPPIIFGEQVAGGISHDWLNLVEAEMESAGYAFGATTLGAHSVAAPHRRQRFYFTAINLDDTTRELLQRRRSEQKISELQQSGELGAQSGMGNANNEREHGKEPDRIQREQGNGNVVVGTRESSAMGHANRISPVKQESRPEEGEPVGEGQISLLDGTGGAGANWDVADASGEGFVRGGQEHVAVNEGWPSNQPRGGSGAVSAAWEGVVWIECSDGKARCFKPGIYPLAARLPGRVGKLRASGNSICPQTAAPFIRLIMERIGI